MTDARETTFDILGYLRRLLRHLLAGALTALLVAVPAFLLLHRAPRTYTATSTVLFQPAPVTTEAQATQQSANVQSQLRNYRQLASSPALLTPLSQRLGEKPDLKTLTTGLIPVWVPGSLMMTFTYTSPEEAEAITVVNEAAGVFKEQSATWTKGQAPALQIPVGTVIPAASPVVETVPSPVKQAVMALALGTLVGLGVMMLLDALAGRRRRRTAVTAH